MEWQDMLALGVIALGVVWILVLCVYRGIKQQEYYDSL